MKICQLFRFFPVTAYSRVFIQQLNLRRLNHAVKLQNKIYLIICLNEMFIRNDTGKYMLLVSQIFHI